MKTLVFLFIPAYLCCSCGAEEQAENDTLQQPTEKALATNQKDENGNNQGYWIFYGKDLPERGSPADGKIEEGNFKDNERDGAWLVYGKDGRTIASRLNYSKGALHDTCHYYNQENTIETVIVYDYGRLISVATLELNKEVLSDQINLR